MLTWPSNDTGLSDVPARTSMILALALASRGAPAQGVRSIVNDAARSGHVLRGAGSDGTLLIETPQGPMLLIVASDAQIHGPHGSIGLAEVRVGDFVHWTGAVGQGVVLIEHLSVLRPTPR